MRSLVQLQRRCACGGSPGPDGECAACKAKRLQRQALAPGPQVAPPVVYDVLRLPGRPLEASVRGEMEARFGHDFSQVRVHADGRAAESARAVAANAYTVGSDVVFGDNRYRPTTGVGSRLLAHELAHTVQQGEGRGGGGASDTVLESDAEQAATATAAGQAQVKASTRPRLSRQAASATTPRVSKIEIFCAVNEMHFHTAERVIVYELTECDLDEGEYEVRVDIDRRKRVVAFTLGENAPKGVRFRFNYLIGVDQRAPIDLLEGQATVHVVASNRVPEEVAETGGAPAAAPNLDGNVDYVTPEEAQRRCDSGDLRVKTFPFRSTRFGAAPIDAWREGPYIRVKQPVYVMHNADFRDQLRTLPIDTFIDGVLLYSDEIVRVHTYEPPWYKLNITGSTDGDEEREFCATGEQMLEIADASTRGTLFNIGLTAVEAGSLFGPVGKLAAPLAKAGRTGLAAATIGTAEAAPTALAGVASRTAVTVVAMQAETQVVSQAVRQTVVQSVAQSAERGMAEAAIPSAARVAAPRVGAGIGASAGTAGAVAGVDIAGGALGDVVAPTPRAPIAGAEEIRVSEAEYRAALELTFPSQFSNQIAVLVDDIGVRAAQRAVANARFVAAVESGDRTLAGTLFHSAAAQEVRSLPVSSLPAGWTIEAERVIQSGAGGSRADVLLRGPAGEIIEFDWKTTGGSAIRYGSRREMLRHAGQITTNIGGQLRTQESRSWVDYVRSLLPDVDWTP